MSDDSEKYMEGQAARFHDFMIQSVNREQKNLFKSKSSIAVEYSEFESMKLFIRRCFGEFIHNDMAKEGK